jgi:hypothetical protein
MASASTVVPLKLWWELSNADSNPSLSAQCSDSVNLC